MKQIYLAFIRGISTNVVSRLGVVFVTTAVVTFILFETLRMSGIVTNSYVGLVTYMALPALFFFGLILIPFGVARQVKLEKITIRELLTRRFDQRFTAPHLTGSNLARTVIMLTLINIIVVGAMGGSMLHFMDTPKFCGTACHKVMNPEWTTYQQSPHARVRCVDCHVGEGTEALISAKMNGLWQIISATFDLYERPIPTPVANLRPARETCEKCHWPELFHGDRIRNLVRYEQDEASTPKYTTLLMKIGSGSENLDSGSHWHIAAKNEVRYMSLDKEREKILWVEAKQPDGSFKRYANRSLSHATEGDILPRTMDCVDCHNRVTHIYEDPSQAIDDRIHKGLIDRNLPFAKKVALDAIMGAYPPDKEKSIQFLDDGVREYYRRNHPEVFRQKTKQIDQLVETAKAVYWRNIHPGMNIEWNVYPNHIGHQDGNGCFRCHNAEMIDSEGQAIEHNCTLCHSILSNGDDQPFSYLTEIDEDNPQPEQEMHRSMRKEFLDFVGK